MEKYSEKTKLEAVEAYRSGERGLVATAKQFEVNVASLRKWIAAYEVNGIAGIRTKRRELYTLEFKLEVLRRARDENLSNRQAAAVFDIRNFNIIAAWERAYEADGMAGLGPRRTGRHREPSKEAGQVPSPQVRDGEDTRSRAELLQELDSLRAENAYLKKAEALVRSSTTSAQTRGRKS